MASATSSTTITTTVTSTNAESVPTTNVGQSICSGASNYVSSVDRFESSPLEQRTVTSVGATSLVSQSQSRPASDSVPASAQSSDSAPSVSSSMIPVSTSAPQAPVNNSELVPSQPPSQRSTEALQSRAQIQAQHLQSSTQMLQPQTQTQNQPNLQPNQMRKTQEPQGQPPSTLHPGQRILRHQTLHPHREHLGAARPAFHHPGYSPHPHMFHHPAMWHPPPAAYIKPYTNMVRSQPAPKRMSKYMLTEKGTHTVNHNASNSTNILDASIATEVQAAADGEKAHMALSESDASVDVSTFKRPASDMSPSDNQQSSDVPENLRNKKMKATDCLLFAATLLDISKGTKDSGDEKCEAANDRAVLNGNEHAARAQESAPNANATLQDDAAAVKPAPLTNYNGIDYTTAGVKPAKKIFRGSVVSPQDEEFEEIQEEEDDPSWPKDVDVLCGRGGLINKHPGNVVYRKIVDYNKRFYQSVHKKHRILVSQSIVQSILNFGGRFMIMEKGKEWTEIEFKRAVQKTSQALRERIFSEEQQRKEEERQNQLENDLSTKEPNGVDSSSSCTKGTGVEQGTYEQAGPIGNNNENIPAQNKNGNVPVESNNRIAAV